jgi:hypothetical protein
VGKPERKIAIRRRRRWQEDNIKIVLREVGLGGMNWIDLAHSWFFEHNNESLGSVKFGEITL